LSPTASTYILGLLLLLLLLLILFYTIIYNNENTSYAPSTYILTEVLNISSYSNGTMSKHQFFTPDGQPLSIYRKGKNHRVLVDTHGNVIAYNGLFGKIAKRVVRAGVGEIPGASLVMEGAGLVGDITGKKTGSPAPTSTSNRFTTEERVAVALGKRI